MKSEIGSRNPGRVISTSMMHRVESLEVEFERLRYRPEAGSAPPVLCGFVIDVLGGPAQYMKRLRSVLSVAVNLGGTADFKEEHLPVDDVPDWFNVISSADEARAPDFPKNGRDAYTSRTEQRPWPLQNWLHRFDPEEDSRGWEWWDVTHAGPSRVRIWVDSWGESFFGCLDLLWAAYTAGALCVDGPVVRRSEEWVAEAAKGILDAS